MSPACEIVVQSSGEAAADLLRFVESWLEGALPSLAPKAGSFAVRLAGDDEVRELNRRLRGKESSTDVLSFPGGPTPEGFHLGDVLVSMPLAVRQAREAGHPLEREIQELLLHGILHCLGHDHETDGGEMAALELTLREEWIV